MSHIHQTKLSYRGIGLIATLVALAIVWRLVNHRYGIAYNLEPITAIGLLAALRFGWRAGLIVPLTALAVSDAIIGNTNILLFTWTAFGLIGLASVLVRRFNHRPNLQLASSVGFAVASSTAFFLITNIGVWLQGYYGPTIDGLMLSLAMGVPFYKTMLIGNLVLVPTAVVAWQTYQAYQQSKITAKATA